MQKQIAISNGIAHCTFRFAGKLDEQDVAQMAEAVEGVMERSDDLRVVLDFSEVDEIAPSAFASAKGMKVSAQSIVPITHYAVVAAPALAQSSIELFGSVLPLEAKNFDAGELEEAQKWASA